MSSEESMMDTDDEPMEDDDTLKGGDEAMVDASSNVSDAGENSSSTVINEVSADVVMDTTANTSTEATVNTTTMAESSRNSVAVDNTSTEATVNTTNARSSERSVNSTHVDSGMMMRSLSKQNSSSQSLPPGLELLEDGSLRLKLRTQNESVVIKAAPPPALTFDDPTKPRLVITHIENVNFKSYAGKQVLGPFHKSFTAIVGPNGSGKSNVIDSMLFVFGYRAAKIRSKKIAVLIHESQRYPNLKSATVKVFFQEIVEKRTDEYETEEEPAGGMGYPIKNSKFCVARTVNKDSSSFYEINGRKCTAKEMVTLLRKKGVDLDHNRFLILQGEVEQIALMKPKAQGPNDEGMIEYLEDIVGSSRFETAIELLQEELNNLDEVRGEKLNRLKLVEKEKDELKGPRDEAVNMLRMLNELAEKKNLQFQFHLHRKTEQAATIEGEILKHDENNKAITDKTAELASNREAKELELAKRHKELSSVAKKHEEVKERMKQLELEDHKLREEMGNKQKKRKEAAAKKKMEEQKLAHQEDLPNLNADKIEECKALKEKLEGKLADQQEKYDEAMATLKEETQPQQDEKDEFENKLMVLKRDFGVKESDRKVLENERDLLLDRQRKEIAKLDQMEQAKEEATVQTRDSASKRNALKVSLPKTEKELRQMEDKLQKTVEEEKQVSEGLRQLQTHFEERKASKNAQTSHNKVLSALMHEKKCGNIPGIFGRLGDLGNIDAKYDVAVSTAGGGQLDVIVIDSFETGQKCIELLKRRNIGRASFLRLDEAKNLQSRVEDKSSSQRNDCEGVPRLIDLIHVSEPRFKVAFYFYLRDTLVAQDIAQAERIAYGGSQRHRVVTLVGEVCEPSGQMSGGGKHQARGKMGLGRQAPAAMESNNQDLKSIEADLMGKQSQLEDLRLERTQLETRCSSLKQRVRQDQQDMEKTKVVAREAEETLRTIDAQIDRQKKAVEKAIPDSEEVDRLEARCELASTEAGAIKERVEAVEADISRLEKSINEIKSKKLKRISKEMNDLNAHIDQVKTEITKLEVQIKTAHRKIEQSKEKITDLELEIKEAEEFLRFKKESCEKAMNIYEEYKDKMQEINDHKSELDEELKSCTQELTTLRNEEKEFRAKQVNSNQRREEFKRRLDEARNGIRHWKRELAKLKLNPIPGEEVASLREYEASDVKDVNADKITFEVTKLEERLSRQPAFNANAIEEYKAKEEVYLKRAAELDEIKSEREAQRCLKDSLSNMRHNEFMKGFGIITNKLKEMYQMITLGGDAELELVDSLNPFGEGVVFSVRPPKKSWKSIAKLSGGEKTLSSLALVFALHYYKPTPLYVMDEIDAALDFKNVSIVANYIKERTKNAQFIIISLRSNMFELADRLVGIYKTYDCTRSISINPDDYVLQVTSSSQTNSNKDDNKIPSQKDVVSTN